MKTSLMGKMLYVLIFISGVCSCSTPSSRQKEFERAMKELESSMKEIEKHQQKSDSIREKLQELDSSASFIPTKSTDKSDGGKYSVDKEKK